MVREPAAAFLKHLRAEKLKTQARRTAYTLRKLSYASALLGVGALNVGDQWPNFNLVLFLVPWVAFAFDLYVLGEDYSVKRFGAFLGAHSPATIEREWEGWIDQNRDPFAPLAMPVLTTLLLLGAAALLSIFGLGHGLLFWTWLLVTAAADWSLYAFYRWLRKQRSDAVRSSALYRPLDEALTGLRSAVESSDRVPSRDVLRHVVALWHLCRSCPEAHKALSDLSNGYAEREFLLCVDRRGEPSLLEAELREGLKHALADDPGLSLWLQESMPAGKSETALLAARWLCHLAGLRHRTVHLFVDHPTLVEHTLLQVRGVGKREAPGCYDMPIGGHTAGMDSVQDTLHREMHEELGLRAEHVDDLQRLGGYGYSGPTDDPRRRNNEFCEVFRCRLRPERWLRVAPALPEVAGLAVFPVSALQGLVKRFPDRVAPGLKASLSLYTGDSAVPKLKEEL